MRAMKMVFVEKTVEIKISVKYGLDSEHEIQTTEKSIDEEIKEKGDINMKIDLPKNWTFTDIWNKSILDRKERPTIARNRLWASELGKSHLDIYLKMQGEITTNPPNARSLRKFEAGNIWEWIVGLI